MTTAEVVDLLNAKPTARGRFAALCPAHPDKSPSLIITEGRDGRTLLKCWAGCSLDEVLAAAGMKLGDLFGESRPMTAVERQTREAQRRHAERRDDLLKAIERRTFDSERLADIEARAWAARLASLPYGHVDEQAVAGLFHLSLQAFREAEAASDFLLESRQRQRWTKSARPEVERVAA